MLAALLLPNSRNRAGFFCVVGILSEGINDTMGYPGARIHRLTAQRIDPHALERRKEVIEYLPPPHDKTGGKAPPKRPSGPLEYALTIHVVLPLAGSMVSIPVALDRRSPVLSALGDKIDSEAARSPTRIDRGARPSR